MVKAELSELDLEVLRDCRTVLFNQARNSYEEQLRKNNVQNMVQIDPKSRRTADTTSSDIIDLYLYAIGVRPDFPRHSIKDLTVFREIPSTPEEDEAETSESEGDETPIEREGDEVGENSGGETANDAPSDEGGTAEDEQKLEPCRNCKEFLEAEIKKCWDYILNVEQVANDRVSHLEHLHQLENIAKKTHPTMAANKADPKADAPPVAKNREKTGKDNQSGKTKNEKEPQGTQEKEHKSKEETHQKRVHFTTAAKNQSQEHVHFRDDVGGASQSNAEPHTNRKPTKGLFPAANQSRTSTENHNTRKPAANNNRETAGGRGTNSFPNKSTKAKRLLTASTQTKSRVAELYLPNITRYTDDTLGDVAERVREHGKRGGLNIIASRIVRNRFNDNIVGCRITVPERQQDDALGNRVWPAGIKCRRWEKREKSDEYQKSHSRQRNQLNHNQRSHINWSENDEGYERDDWYQEGESNGDLQDRHHEREDYRQGYNRDGYDRDGYDGEGYDGYGFDRDGYDRHGYDREGYDKDGYAAEEYEDWEERYSESQE